MEDMSYWEYPQKNSYFKNEQSSGIHAFDGGSEGHIVIIKKKPVECMHAVLCFIVTVHYTLYL